MIRVAWALTQAAALPVSTVQEYPSDISPQSLARLLTKTSGVLTGLELGLYEFGPSAIHQLGLQALSRLRALKLTGLCAKELPEPPSQLEELYATNQGKLLTSIFCLGALTRLRVLAIEFAEILEDLTPIGA